MRIDGLAAKRVLVTGAASGIGRATAQRVGREGGVLHLLDIDGDGLDGTRRAIEEAGGTVSTSDTVDLRDEPTVAAYAERLTADHGPMDVVMNVAGIATWGTVRSLTNEQWHKVVDVNLMGPIHVIEHLLPPMIEAGRGGWLVNVSSAAGLIGMPWHAAYSASKFGLRGVSEVLRFDLRRHGIGVSLVCPGGVDTGLTETIEIAGVSHESPRFQKLRDRFRSHAVTPEYAADAIVDGMLRGRYWIYTSPDIRLLHALERHLPRTYALVMRGANAAANRALPAVDAATRAGHR